MGRSVATDPKAGDVYVDPLTGATFTVETYDRRRAYVVGVRSDFGPWSVFRRNLDWFYERAAKGVEDDSE